MPELSITLHSQQGIGERDRFQAHQWAEIPDELSVVYMTGGLKRVRRIVESYFRYRFSAEASKCTANRAGFVQDKQPRPSA